MRKTAMIAAISLAALSLAGCGGGEAADHAHR